MRVIVVGAGVIGLAIAETLTRRGVEVELFERNTHAGREASWAAAGILSPQGEAKGPGPLLDLLLTGYSFFPEAVARLQAATGIDLLYRARGMLSVGFSAGDEQDLERELIWQQKAGLRLERMTASQVISLEPALDGPVRVGVWYPQTAQLDVRRLVDAYRRTVGSQGGAIRTNASVRRFLVERDEVVGIETEQGTFTADWVVNCAGSWAGFDQGLSIPVPVVPVKGQILQFQTSVPLFQRIIRSPRAYLVQRAPGELIAGTTVEYAGYDTTVTDEGQESIRRGAQEISSRVASLPLSSAWAGLRPGTPDHLPILGFSPFKNLLLATGHFRNGVLLAPLTGKLMGDLIIEGGCTIDLSAFSVTRFLAQAARN